MKTLSSEDAFFLYFETPEQHQHTVGTLVLDPATAPWGCDIETLVARLNQSVTGKPELNQKLMQVPFSMAAPVLVEDPDYKFENHIHRIGVPAPGTVRELAAIAADVASTQLDRSRPLWECWFVSGLEGGRLALILKSHHCLADAANGQQLMADLFETEPTPPKPERAGSKPPAVQAPSRLRVTYEALKAQRQSRSGYFDLARRTVHSLRERRRLFGESERMDELVPALMEAAPPLRFNGPISPFRSTAFTTLSLTDVKAIKNALGVTLNDVVLTACTLALRQYLLDIDDLPDKPLVCYVPVALIRKGERAESAVQGNQIGTMGVRLPVQLDEPSLMMAAVRDSTVAAKRVFEGSFENLFQRVIGVMPSNLADRALKLYASEALIERAPSPCNVVISNIPFSPKPLYIAGARIEATFPMGPVISGQGPNITLMSYMDSINLSVQACREQLPDPWVLADGIVSAVDTLRQMAGGQLAEPESDEPKPGRASAAQAATRRKTKPARKTTKGASKRPPARKKAAVASKAGAAKKKKKRAAVRKTGS